MLIQVVAKSLNDLRLKDTELSQKCGEFEITY